jgi:serine/threonine protein kinase/formylglycine-generating enzyme required for sulfatase activity
MKECQVCRRCYSDDLNNCPDDGDKLMVSLRGSPTIEGRYQLERRLGEGGMGIVYKARHSYLKTTHAIKVILPDLVGHDPMFSTRFRQEAMIAAAIRHPNIVLVTDFGIAQDILPFLVMEFIKGRSLQEIFVQRGSLPAEIAIQIVTAIAAGVGAAHRQGFIHRDLKPLNIMLQDDKPISEAIKILDFGLAKMRTGEMLGSFVQAKTTGLVGSPFYMAPEQWSDDEIDSRADIYSLGIILYQMLAGEVPFKGSSMPTIMRAHLMSEPPTFISLGVRVPEAVETVVRRALEKSPKDRFATVEDFVAGLRDAIVRTELTLRGENSLSQLETLTLGPAGRPDGTGVTSSWMDATRQPLGESRTPIQEDADRLAREFEEAQRRAEDARKRAEQAAQRRAEEEAARKLAEEEAARKRTKEAELRRREEEEVRRRIALEAARKLLEEEEARKAAEEERQRNSEAEAARLRAKEDAERMANEIAVLQQRAEEARGQAEEEARKRSEEEVARRLAEEKAERLTREVEEAQRRAEEARRRSVEEARKRAEEDAQRKNVDEEKTRKRAEEEELRFAEVEAARLVAKEEADRLAREVEEAQRRAEEARLRTEEEASKRIEQEAARKRAEEEAERLAQELLEARRRVEEERKQAEEQAPILRAKEDAVRKHIEEELQRRSEEVERKWAEEEASRRLAEREAARKRAEEDAKRFAEQEAARKRAEEEASRLAREIEDAEERAREALLKAEQEARERAKENEIRRSEEEVARQRAKEVADRLGREVEAAQLRAEEARAQAEEESRKRSEEETARRLAEEKAEALESEVREAQRRAEEARQHVEEEVRKQAEQENRRKTKEEAVRAEQLKERQKLLQEIQQLEEEKRQREEAMRVAELEAAELAKRRAQEEAAIREAFPSLPQSSGPGSETAPVLNQQPLARVSQAGAGVGHQAETARVGGALASGQLKQPRSGFLRVLPIVSVATLILLGAAYGIYKVTRPAAAPPTVNKETSGGSTAGGSDDFVLLPAGSFQMGRNDGTSPEGPAHTVSLGAFYLQRTEVTNGEYAEFVRSENYQAPTDWVGKNPPPGEERWPVSNVSQEDAVAFARWRSKRENITYRLPTEAEWEYAARGETRQYQYPWGNTWFDDRANLGTGRGSALDHARPVGSYPQGATASGILDLIGNVWEWTSSEASFYPGNQSPFPARERGWLVVRGGSHQSLYANAIRERGSREFPVTFRQWFRNDTRAPTLGFRLVRENQSR